jgi:hypothetical protein
MTSPKVVISPVIAIEGTMGFSIAMETRAENKEIPADGPSFGMAPMGT